MIKCSRCKLEKTPEEYHRSNKRKTGRTAYCKVCASKFKREWYAENRKIVSAKTKIYNRKLREELLAHYGGCCQCCGEVRFEFLAVDHIHGEGNKHRQSLKRGSIGYWLRQNNYPEGYRILCHNCNMAHGVYGYCPHLEEYLENRIA